MNYPMTYIGDKGKDIYITFTFDPAVGENPTESDTLEGVYGKYGAYVVPTKERVYI